MSAGQLGAGTVVLLCAAGGVGAVARFVVDGVVSSRTRGEFPWATLLINVSGSLLLGVLTGLALAHGEPTGVKAVLGTGFCGGYTTFSTATVEAVRLARRGRVGTAVVQVLLSVGGTLAAAWLGITIAS